MKFFVAVNRNHNSLHSVFLGVNMMAAMDPRQNPFLLLCELRHPLASDGLHIANSRILSLGDAGNSSCPAASQPSIASRRFDSNSATVSPCVTHLGSAGTSAQNPPSSALCMMALNFMGECYHTLPCAKANFFDQSVSVCTTTSEGERRLRGWCSNYGKSSKQGGW